MDERESPSQLGQDKSDSSSFDAGKRHKAFAVLGSERL